MEQQKEEILEWRKLNLKYKKILLSNFVENVNKNIEDNNEKNIIQRNNIILKNLCSNLKNIDDNNIEIKNGRLESIEGLLINEDGLIVPKINILYKSKKSILNFRITKTIKNDK